MPTITKRRSSDGSIAFLAQVRVAGFKPSAKTFAEKKAARAWADELEELLRTQRKRGAGVRADIATLTVGALLLEFLADPETTALRYYDDLHRLCSWWVQQYGTQRVVEFGVITARQARDSLRVGRGPATVNRYLSAMRSAWNWGRSAGLVANEQLWPERLMLTEPRGRTRYLSDEEIAALLKKAREHSSLMHAAIVVSIATGVRQSELLRLDWSDVDFTRQTLRVRESKNDEPRAVHLPQSAADALRSLQSAKIRAIGPAVFIMENGTRLKKSTLEARWKRLRDSIPLDNFRWHDLRHTAASVLAQNGATLLEIGTQLGHKSPAVTMRYSHLVQGAALPAHAKLNEKLRG